MISRSCRYYSKEGHKPWFQFANATQLEVLGRYQDYISYKKGLGQMLAIIKFFELIKHHVEQFLPYQLAFLPFQ